VTHIRWARSLGEAVNWLSSGASYLPLPQQLATTEHHRNQSHSSFASTGRAIASGSI